ncbi:MAG: hypothetical protein V4538_02390 [Bacteroidota bacterium]
MNTAILSGSEVLARIIAADNKSLAAGGSGILTSEQRAAAKSGQLNAIYDEKYHRAYLANTGADTGVGAYDVNVEKEYGVTNLEKGMKLADDFVMVATRSRVAVIPMPNTTPGVTDLRSTTKLKVAEYTNLLQAPGAAQTLVTPSEVTSAEYELKINENRQFSFGYKNYFQSNNRKDSIEASAADSIPVPNGLILVKKGKALKPILYLPNGVTLPNTAAGANAVAYATEFTYIGYTLVIENN